MEAEEFCPRCHLIVTSYERRALNTASFHRLCLAALLAETRQAERGAQIVLVWREGKCVGASVERVH